MQACGQAGMTTAHLSLGFGLHLPVRLLAVHYACVTAIEVTFARRTEEITCFTGQVEHNLTTCIAICSFVVQDLASPL